MVFSSASLTSLLEWMPKTKGNIQDKRKHQAVDQNDFGKQNIFWATKVMWPRKAGKQKQGTQLTKSIIDLTRAGLQDHLFTKPDELDLDLDTMY